MLRLLLFAFLLCAACSQPSRSDVSNRHGNEAGARGTASDSAGDVEGSVAESSVAIDGELGRCDPLGAWRGKGRVTEVGDCNDAPAELSFELTVSGRPDGGYVLALAGALGGVGALAETGELVPDRLAAREGVCALGFRVNLAGRGDQLASVLYVHALASGTGSGVWQRMDGAEPSCSQGFAFEISRGARSAE